MNKEQKALQEIEKKLNKAREIIKEAMKIADENDVCFHWHPPALSHGEGTHMGGYYYGKTHPRRENQTFDEFGYPEYGQPYEDGWLPSSMSC